MEDYRININYAKALFLVASEANVLDEVNRDMRLVNSVCAENHVLNVVFANPVIREDKKVGILKELFESRVSKVSMLFMAFVVKKRHTVNLKGISNAFVELYRESKGIVLGELVTHLETDDSAKAYVRRLIEEYTGKQVELHTATDPHMLGGFKMEFDHNMYDARLRTKIMKLRKEFANNVYESKL